MPPVVMRTNPVVVVKSFSVTAEEAVAQLLADHPARLGVAVRHTSREPAEGEENGVHYHFVSKTSLELGIASGEFAFVDPSVGGDLVATSHAAIAAVTAAKKSCVLLVSVEQAELLAAARFDARFVLLLPPSPAALEARLESLGLSRNNFNAELKRAAHEAELPARLPGLFAHVLNEGASASETAELLTDALVPSATPVVVCGPSGVGSSDLIAKLLAEFPADFARCVSHTTRAPRPGEQDGVHYRFLSTEAMEAAIANGEYAESCFVRGHHYGTPLADVQAAARAGKSPVISISVQGARAIKEAGVLRPVFVFVAPPSLELLEERLRAHGDASQRTAAESEGAGAAAGSDGEAGGEGSAAAAARARALAAEERLQRRLADAKIDLAAAAEPGFFDFVVVNANPHPNPNADRGYRLLRQKLTGKAPPVVLCGPAGVGNRTLIRLLLKTAPADYGFCVSHTTRAPRPGEEDGVHYHFTSKERMEAAIANGEFLEHALVEGHYYGTSAAALAKVEAEGKSCILDISMQGVRALKAKGLSATFLFVAPPSLEVLEARLRGRAHAGGEEEAAEAQSDMQIALRVQDARELLKAAKDEPALFDHVVINEQLTGTFCHLRELLTGMAPPLLICGPSGVGKGTLIARLLADFPADFGFCVSHTTRAPRPGEEDGVHYHFTSKERMEAAIANGEFVEHAHVHGNYYGTSVAAVETVTRMGKSCILDLDVQGARNVKGSALGAVFLFVAPPSLEELEARLRGRGTETEEKIQLRLGNARGEIAAADEKGFFDHVLINGDLEETYVSLKRTIAHYRTLHLTQGLVARSLGRLTADLPPPIPPEEAVVSGYQIGQHTLSLRANFVSSANLVLRCAGLHMLDLSHNKLTSLQPLGGLRFLLSLDASFNMLDATGALFEPPLNLQELNLSHNRIASASAVCAHRQLRSLNLSHNELTSMDGLEGLGALTELTLSDNQIRAIAALDGSPLLQTLHLASNRIERLSGLASLRLLTALDLRNNLLSSLKGLEGCTSLMDLLVADNAIANANEVAHIAPLALLRSLDLSNNPVCSCGSEAVPYRLHVAQQLPSLVALDGQPVSAEEKVGAAWHFGQADADLRKIRDTHLPPSEGALPPRVPLPAS